MAAMGCVGVNLHGGANGYYSPIVGSIKNGFAARPEYYGLMLAQEFAGRGLEGTTLKAKGANLTAYAAGGDGAPGLVAIFNKDARDAQVTLSGAAGDFKRAVVERLVAPAIDSKEGVTLRGATVGGDGQFHPRAGEPLAAQGGKLSVRVPAYSAALIRLG
jgi:hypothetical protein